MKLSNYFNLYFRELAEMKSWKEDVLHKIVDSFLDLRFPMFLVLNKADLPGADSNVERLAYTVIKARDNV